LNPVCVANTQAGFFMAESSAKDFIQCWDLVLNFFKGDASKAEKWFQTKILSLEILLLKK